MASHFLLLATATILVTLLFLSPPATANDSPVLDIEGNPLEAGSQYLVLTAGWGAAGRGGLTPESRPPHQCPRYVAQHSVWLENGRPVTFYPSDSSQKQITQGDDVNIAFRSPDGLCRSSGVWRITFDSETQIPYVATNGVIGNPGTAETLHNWFKIELAFGDLAYRIVFCFAEPTPAPGNAMFGRRRECRQLDAIQRGPNGVFFLGLVPLDQNLPFFGFVFKKVDTTTSTTNNAAAFY